MCWLTARLVVESVVLTCIHRVYVLHPKESAVLGCNPSQQIRVHTMISPRTATRGQLVSIPQVLGIRISVRMLYAKILLPNTPQFEHRGSKV